MKKCDTCIYRNENEYHKPCIVYRDDCEHYEKERGDMTREEAIGHIKDVICENNTIKPNIVVFEQEKEALYMAIKALEQEPCNTDTCKVVKAYMNEWDKPNNSDAISRQAVIDIIHLFFTEEVDKIPTKKTEDGEVYIIRKCQPLFEMNKAICKRIKALPPVNPQVPKTIPVSVIEDIKSDIADFMDEIPTLGNCKEGWHNSGQRIGLEQACEIIDRHISGKTEGEEV